MDTKAEEEVDVQLGLFELPAPVAKKSKSESVMYFGWKPEPLKMAAIRSTNPDLDVDKELGKFVAYWRTQDVPRKDWVAAFRNWLTNARKFELENEMSKRRKLPPAKSTVDNPANL